MNNLMEKIDNIKEKITDGEYKEICDEMMKINNNKFYKVTFVKFSVEPSPHEDQIAVVRSETDTKIVKLVEDVSEMEGSLKYLFFRKNIISVSWIREYEEGDFHQLNKYTDNPYDRFIIQDIEKME